MFKLTKKARNRAELKQFTMTMDKSDIETLTIMAEANELKFHGFIKSILLGYIDYVKKEGKNG